MIALTPQVKGPCIPKARLYNFFFSSNEVGILASLSVVLESYECTPVVVRSLDDCSLPVDINSMSSVPEHPDYLDDWKVSDS